MSGCAPGIALPSWGAHPEDYIMSNTTQTMVPAEQLVIITPRIEIWSGTVQIQRDSDLKPVSGQLPPKGLVSDGRKQLIDPAPLRPLYNVRKNIERSLKEDGFTGLVGTGVALTARQAEAFIARIPEYRKAFEEAVDDLVLHLDDHYLEQEKRFPAWAGMLASARLSESAVRGRCRFGVAIFRLAPPDPARPDSEASKLYEEMTSQALPSLLQGIGDEATALIGRVEGKARLRQSVAEAIRRLVAKLKAFAFLDPRVQPAAASLTDIVSRLPMQGPLDPVQASSCLTVLKQLAKPDQILVHGVGVLQDLKNQQSQGSLELEEEESQVEAVESGAAIKATPPITPPQPAPAAPRRAGFSMAM